MASFITASQILSRFDVSLKKEKTLDFSRVSLVVEVTGFEPATFWSRTKRATKLRYTSKYGANEGTRTLDLLITNQLLYRLSYIGVRSHSSVLPDKKGLYQTIRRMSTPFLTFF